MVLDLPDMFCLTCIIALLYLLGLLDLIDLLDLQTWLSMFVLNKYGSFSFLVGLLALFGLLG